MMIGYFLIVVKTTACFNLFSYNAAAPELYDLTTLQKEASKRYGFSPKQTLNIMQSLYEHHKVLTYPRTDSRYLTNDMTETLKDRIKACQNGSYKKAAAALLRKEIKVLVHNSSSLFWKLL